MWCKICQRSRNFNFIGNKKEGEEIFIPILDLFHHSYLRANIGFQLDRESNLIRLTAIADIKKGDLLYISYTAMPIQGQIAYFGFADVESECYIDIPVAYDIDIICDLIQLRIDGRLKSGLKDIIANNMKQYNRVIFINIKSKMMENSIFELMKLLGREFIRKLTKIFDQVLEDLGLLKMRNRRNLLQMQRRYNRQFYRKIYREIKKGITATLQLKNKRY